MCDILFSVDCRLIHLILRKRLKFHQIYSRAQNSFQQWPTDNESIYTIHVFIDTCVMATTSSNIHIHIFTIEHPIQRFFFIFSHVLIRTPKFEVGFWSDLPTILIFTEWISSITMATRWKKNPSLLPMLLQQIILWTKITIFPVNE